MQPAARSAQPAAQQQRTYLRTSRRSKNKSGTAYLSKLLLFSLREEAAKEEETHREASPSASYRAGGFSLLPSVAAVRPPPASTIIVIVIMDDNDGGDDGEVSEMLGRFPFSRSSTRSFFLSPLRRLLLARACVPRFARELAAGPRMQVQPPRSCHLSRSSPAHPGGGREGGRN